MAVGRETAFGVLRHLQSDEVQHILVEVAWQAKHSGRTAFLGPEEDWRADGRVALAEELAKHGHEIRHIRRDGSVEEHGKAWTVGDMPDFLAQEESRLRKIHAQRQAGELHRPEKSAVDRSTEAVARSLASEKTQVDVSAELRDAENQDALVKAQKRMVRLHVSAGKKEPGLGKKQLVAVPSHIAREAAAVRERLEAKKGEKSKDSSTSKTGRAEAEQVYSSSAAASSSFAAPGQRETTGVDESQVREAPDVEGFGESVEPQEPERRRRWGSSDPEQRVGRRWGNARRTDET